MLLLDPLDAVPLPSQVLFPQADLVVATADGQDVTAETPAHAPEHGVEVQDGAFPFDGVGRVGGGARGPYPHGLVL